jgi:hypothetical protein
MNHPYRRELTKKRGDSRVLHLVPVTPDIEN